MSSGFFSTWWSSIPSLGISLYSSQCRIYLASCKFQQERLGQRHLMTKRIVPFEPEISVQTLLFDFYWGDGFGGLLQGTCTKQTVSILGGWTGGLVLEFEAFLVDGMFFIHPNQATREAEHHQRSRPFDPATARAQAFSALARRGASGRWRCTPAGSIRSWTIRRRCGRCGVNGFLLLGPSASCPLTPFLGEASPTKMDYRKKGYPYAFC